MKRELLNKIVRPLLISLVVLGSVAFFGYEVYRNMGTGSKASGSGVVTITMSNSATGPIAPGTTFTIGITLSANSGNTLSAADLFFMDPQDALDFNTDTNSFPLEEVSSSAFDDKVRVDTTTRSVDSSVKLNRITLVAKRATSSLKSSTTIRLRFKARPTTSFAYPSAITFGINTGQSIITGPGINGNQFSLTPANISIPVSLGCTTANPCQTGYSCYQNTCRTVCGTGGSCAGLYHCEQGVCVPGAGGSSSSSSTSLAPTATPAPTARPDKANLYFHVKMPDVAQGIAVVPQVRIQVYDGLNQRAEAIVTLYREAGTDFFRTNGAVELDIPSTPSPKPYNIFIKQLKTVRHKFTANLQRGTVVDCTSVAGGCNGTLQSPADHPLVGGDTDGFNDGSNGIAGSPSYNRIDNVDWQRMTQQYKATSLPAEPNADFNMDGRIDILDLGIIGKNYGASSE